MSICNSSACEAEAICTLVVRFAGPAGEFVLKCEPCLEHLDEGFARVGEALRGVLSGEGEYADAADALNRQQRDAFLQQRGV